MTALTQELVPVLKKLRLSGILATSDLRMKEAVDQNLSHGEFLWRLLGDEIERRDGKQLDARLRRATFEGVTQPRTASRSTPFGPAVTGSTRVTPIERTRCRGRRRDPRRRVPPIDPLR